MHRQYLLTNRVVVCLRSEQGLCGQGQGWDFVVAGHSLGAGIAAPLAAEPLSFAAAPL